MVEQVVVMAGEQTVAQVGTDAMELVQGEGGAQWQLLAGWHVPPKSMRLYSAQANFAKTPLRRVCDFPLLDFSLPSSKKASVILA